MHVVYAPTVLEKRAHTLCATVHVRAREKEFASVVVWRCIATMFYVRGYAIKNERDRRVRGVVPGVEATCKINVLNVCHPVT